MDTFKAIEPKNTPVPLEGPLSDRKVFELVRASYAAFPVPVIVGIEPVPAETIYQVKDGFECEFKYFQSIDGHLVQGFKANDLLVV